MNLSLRPKALEKGTAHYLGDCRVRYTWPCGHESVVDHGVGPILEQLSPMTCELLARYFWNNRTGVQLPPCPTCQAAFHQFE